MIKPGMLALVTGMWLGKHEDELQEAEDVGADEDGGRGLRSRENRDIVAFQGGWRACEEGVLEWLKESKAPPALIKQFAEKRRD
jgi:hypothetical protein